MFTDYQKCKEEVIAEYDKFNALVQTVEAGISRAGLQKSQTVFEEVYKRIEKTISDIRADRFRIMIAGEAKSGKSTFINAYLGLELLPMDVKQCTSAIVEIKYGKQFRMVATYAGGQQKTLTDEDKIRQFLKQNAALNDEYRDIPVPTINHNILVKFGKQGKKVPESEIQAFLNDKQVQKANIHHIDDYDKKIRHFIETHKNSWASIVTKIEIFFPFNDALKGVEIIDSPGVCALGGVEDFTADYIENANAIIFLKPISGQALESVQFNDFMANKSVARNKNALFLVLTRSSNVTPAERERLKEEAYKQFKQLPQDNILVVDSKAQLYVNRFSECANFGEVKAKINELKEKNELDDFVQADRGEADGDLNELIRLLRNRSNFRAVDEALSTFGHKAHYIIMAELLDNILKVYRGYSDYLKDNISYLEQKAEDPVQLTAKIALLEAELDEIQNKMHRGIDAVTDSYTGENGSIRRTAKQESEDFLLQVERINPKESGCFERLQKLVFSKIDLFKGVQESIEKELVDKFNQSLIEITNDSEIPYSALEPNFSVETFEVLFEETKDAAKIRTEIEPARCFHSAVFGNVYSRDKHFEIVKKEIVKRLSSITNTFLENLEDFVNGIRKVYIQKLADNAKAKKSELDSVIEAKMTAELIAASIESFRENMGLLETNMNAISAIRGGVDRYVQ